MPARHLYAVPDNFSEPLGDCEPIERAERVLDDPTIDDPLARLVLLALCVGCMRDGGAVCDTRQLARDTCSSVEAVQQVICDLIDAEYLVYDDGMAWVIA